MQLPQHKIGFKKMSSNFVPGFFRLSLRRRSVLLTCFFVPYLSRKGWHKYAKVDGIDA